MSASAPDKNNIIYIVELPDFHLQLLSLPFIIIIIQIQLFKCLLPPTGIEFYYQPFHKTIRFVSSQTNTYISIM